MNKVSNCCTTFVYEETDICSACKEHCDIIDLDALEEDILDPDVIVSTLNNST